MARFRNDFQDPPEQYIEEGTGLIKERASVRVLPTLGWVAVPPGGEFSVPDEEWPHWVAGGFRPLTPDPAAPKPASKPVAPPASAATPQPAAEGSDPQ